MIRVDELIINWLEPPEAENALEEELYGVNGDVRLCKNSIKYIVKNTVL